MKTMMMFLLSACGLFAGDWELPREATVKDSGPRTYRFIVDYVTTNLTGQTLARQRVTAEYTRGLPGGEVIWHKVAVSEANGNAELGPAQKQEFMEGYRYRQDSKASKALYVSMLPDFFKGFPPDSTLERTLIWDQAMFDLFAGAQFPNLKLNEPYRIASPETVNVPGVGPFSNRDVQLVWVGKSRRNGRNCAVIDYSGYINPLQIINGGMDLKGQSRYWGLIWVSLATRQIEYATLNENVTAEIEHKGQSTPVRVNVFRTGVFEPIQSKQLRDGLAP
jgi:hypothetical protein